MLCLEFYSNTRRRGSLQAILHAATFLRRMDKLFRKMDPLRPSKSEEYLMRRIRRAHAIECGYVPEPEIAKIAANPFASGKSKRWGKVNARKTIAVVKSEPASKYSFALTFERIFAKLKIYNRFAKEVCKSDSRMVAEGSKEEEEERDI